MSGLRCENLRVILPFIYLMLVIYFILVYPCTFNPLKVDEYSYFTNTKL